MAVKKVRIYQLPKLITPATELAGAVFEVEVLAGPVAGAYLNKQLTAEQLAEYLALEAVQPPTAAQIAALLQAGEGIAIGVQGDKIVISSTVQAATPGPTAPKAPTGGQVDDTGDTFSFLPTAAYPAFSQYKVAGLPGVTGAVVLDSTNSYVSGNRIYVKVVGAVPVNGLAVYVTGSGNVPDGAPLLNKEAFTGSAVVTPTNPLAVSLAIAVASIVAGNSLAFSVTASGGTGPYAYAVLATNVTTGNSIALGSASSGTWTPTVVADYELTARVTDSMGAIVTSLARQLRVTAPASNQVPVANAGADNLLTLPSSSAILQGSGTDSDGTIVAYSWSQAPGDPASVTFNNKNVATPNVSGLTVVGTYHFNLIVTDDKGAVSLADEVVIVVNPAPVAGTKDIKLCFDGNSIFANLGGDLTASIVRKLRARLGAVGDTRKVIYDLSDGTHPANVAISGQTEQQMLDNIADVAAMYDARYDCYLVSLERYNQIRGYYSTETAAHAFSVFKAYNEAIKQMPFKGHIAYTTPPDCITDAYLLSIGENLSTSAYRTRPDFKQVQAELSQLVYNYAVNSNGQLVAARLDLDTLYNPANTTGSEAESSDGVHPNQFAIDNRGVAERGVDGCCQMLLGQAQRPPFLAPVSDPDLISSAHSFLVFDPKDATLAQSNGTLTSTSTDDGYATRGLATYKMGAGNDCEVAFRLTSKNAMLMLLGSRLLATYQDSIASIYQPGSSFNKLNAVNLGNPNSASADVVSSGWGIMRRVGATGVLTALIRNGTTETLLYTYTTNSKKDIIIGVSMVGNGNGKMVAAQGKGLTAVSAAAPGNLLPGSTLLPVPTRAGGLVETDGVLSSTSGSAGYGSTGLPNMQVQQGVAGFVAHKVAAVNARNALLELKTGNFMSGYGDAKFVAWVANTQSDTADSTIYNVLATIGGTRLASVVPQVGDFVRISWDSDMHYYAELSQDGGVSWTQVIDYGIYTGPLYIQVDLIGSAYLYYLQHVGLVAA